MIESDCSGANRDEHVLKLTGGEVKVTENV